MPDHSTWLDVLSGLVFLVGLTFYASRMIPPAVPKEPPWIPAKWNRSGPIIGIDIGTTYSRIGFVASEHRVKVFDAVPSRICVTKNDNFVEHMGITGCSDPGSITHTARGLIRSTHAAATTQYFRLDNDQHELDSLSAQGSPISPGSDQQSSFPLPSSILAALLYELYTRAETYYASRISQAIITVPADFSAVERKVITDAALLAGLSPVRLLDEPIAIAIAYGLDKLKNASYALVVDIGSTAHAALLHIEHSDISVISTARNETLGGDAFNRLLSDYVAEAYKNSLNDNLDAMQSLVVDDQVEMAKLTLSFSEQAVIAVPIFGGPWFLVPLTRDDFNNIATDLVEDILDEMIDQMLSNAGIAANVIDHVILAGGSAYIPALRNRFGQRFPGKVPLSASEKYPDEAVVYGAALFARRLALGEVPEETKIYVQDSTPMRFGIEVAGGLFATLIPRNSPLPATNTKRFSLQGGPIRVFTGTGEYTNATEFLGSLVLPPNINTARLKITFDLSAYGVLNVTAADEQGRSRSTLMEPRRPSEIEISRMQAEAAALAEREDVKRRMDMLHTYFTHSQPVLRRHLKSLAADDPQRRLREQIVDAMDAVDVWMAAHKLSASREQFFGKLTKLEELLRQDVELRRGLPTESSAGR